VAGMSGLISVLEPPTVTRLKRAGAILLVVLITATIMAVVVFGLARIWPRDDQTPAAVARRDEKTAARTATAIDAATQTQTHDATVHIDLTTKEIHDAFSALPAPQPAAGPSPRVLPAAPVDGMRDRLNEGIARANRAAGSTAAVE
jgi:hypothetical protein